MTKYIKSIIFSFPFIKKKLVVKTPNQDIAREYGIRSWPALIYFEKQIPSVYEGDITAEEDVLQWLVQQKTEDTIESVNRELLEQLIETTHYLVVFFCKKPSI